MAGLDSEALKEQLKEYQQKGNTLLDPSGTGEMVKYSEVIPVLAKRTLEIPAKGVNIKFANKLMPEVEVYWHQRGRYPETTWFMEKFGFTKEEVLQVNDSKLWLACLDRRGIRRPNVAEDFLSHKQIAAISLITNFNDSRHQEVKLASIGVSAEEYNGWLQQPSFKSHLSARSDEVLNHVGVDANMALAHLIKARDFRATKFYFEITGKASSPEAINVKQAMQILIEAVQKHVKDPEVLAAIGQEVQTQRQVQGLV